MSITDSGGACGSVHAESVRRRHPLRRDLGPDDGAGRAAEDVDVNIDGTALLLDFAHRHGLRRFVFLLVDQRLRNVGKTATRDTPLRPTSVYGASKVAGEQLVQAFTANMGSTASACALAGSTDRTGGNATSPR